MQILDTAFYFIVTLGILVFIHELGHFLAAKLFGMRVDRFSIGLPPRAFGKTIGGTIVFIVSDGGWKYLSTGAYTDDLDDAESNVEDIIYF